MVEGVQLVRTENVVAAIDFPPGSHLPQQTRPARPTAGSPRRHPAAWPFPEGSPPRREPRRHLRGRQPRVPGGRHRGPRACRGDPVAGSWRGQGKCISPPGSANVEKHRKDVAAKVVADVRVHIDHLDDTKGRHAGEIPLCRHSLEGLRGRSLGGVTRCWACHVPEPWFRLLAGPLSPGAGRFSGSPGAAFLLAAPFGHTGRGRLQHHHRAGADLPVDGEPDQWVPRRVAVGAMRAKAHAPRGLHCSVHSEGQAAHGCDVQPANHRNRRPCPAALRWGCAAPQCGPASRAAGRGRW